jgi:bacterioferritin-associated ferredoxin
MRYNPSDKSSKSGQHSSSYGTGKTSKGFADLDPSHMGFGTPDWLESSTPPPTPPANSASSASGDAPSALASQAFEQGRAAELASAPRTLMEGMKVVCICKGIKKRVFWKALDDGAQTKEEVNRQTGSGSGGCQGRRCGPRILDLLRNHDRK